MRETESTDIGTDRQLFVDDYWVAEATDVRRVLHEPVRREIAVAGDKPWDHHSICAACIIDDGDRYRMWYRCDHDPAMRFKRSGHDAAYAESTDGVHWDKPNLGLFEVNGSRDNNIVWMGPGTNLVPFRDPNSNVPDDERYKAFVRTREILALASPDGIRWHLMRDEPVMTDGPFDSVNRPFWDVERGEYVAYTRGVAGAGTFKGGVRWIRRSTSKDFLNWTPLELIRTGDTPFEHLYTNACVQYERAPGTYLMFPSRYVVDRLPDPDWTYDTGVDDIVFMSSRDGINFDRSFMEAFIRPGLDRNNWHDRGIYIECGLLQTSPEELSLYGMENSHLPSVRIRRYTLRTDGFVSMNAGYSGGEFTTRPLVFSGDELEVNYSTSAVGSIRVEVQDGEGHALPGYALDDCPETFGDEIEGVVRWKNGASLSDLAGKPVVLRFALMDADVYAFKFRQSGL